MTIEWSTVLMQVEDALFPTLALSVWERAMYYHLLRQTWACDRPQVRCSVQGVAAGAGMSDFKAREILRSLHQKGCIKIEGRSRFGHEIRVLLPAEMDLPVRVSEPPPDLASIDFFLGRQYLAQIIARENGRCFYCLSAVEPANCELDHATPQSDRADNSYRNIVASCFDCNKLKQDLTAEEYLRRVIRRNLLSAAEFDERMAALAALRRGDLAPVL